MKARSLRLTAWIVAGGPVIPAFPARLRAEGTCGRDCVRAVLTAFERYDRRGPDAASTGEPGQAQSLTSLMELLRSHGLPAVAVHSSEPVTLLNQSTPLIAHWHARDGAGLVGHYVVVSPGEGGGRTVFDPACGTSLLSVDQLGRRMSGLAVRPISPESPPGVIHRGWEDSSRRGGVLGVGLFLAGGVLWGWLSRFRSLSRRTPCPLN